MTTTKAEQLRIAGQLPSPKGVALAIMEVCSRDDATLEEVARIVQTDPALSSRLLRKANAAGQGGRAVASVKDAVMRLGMNTVRLLAMSFSLVDQHASGPCPAFDYGAFWSHSLLLGVSAQELCKVVRVTTPDDLFACGLLARIGELALATIYPQEYAGVLQQKLSTEALLEAERQVLHTDHLEFTAVILEDCGIPKALAEPVVFHEQPEASGFREGSRPYQLLQLLVLARRMADLGCAPEAERHAKVGELMRMGGQIGLDAQAFGALFDGAVAQWHSWGELLRIPTETLPDFERLTETPPQPATPATPDAQAPLHVLVAMADARARAAIVATLSHDLGCHVTQAGTGGEALTRALQETPDVLMLERLLPEMDRVEVCRALRATEWGRSIYVIMMVESDDPDRVEEALEAGADDYLPQPLHDRLLHARIRAARHHQQLRTAWRDDRAQLRQFMAELALSNRRLEHAAMTDLLTGLPNRRAGLQALEQAWSASTRTGQPLAALMIDIDHFKSINDRYGHAGGDVVLQSVAKTLLSAARRHDTVCRLGGEEFLLVCHDADLRAAILAARRVQQTVRSHPPQFDGKTVPISVSIGIAVREPQMADADALIRAADQALYAAKHDGRDRIFVSAAGKVLGVPSVHNAP